MVGRGIIRQVNICPDIYGATDIMGRKNVCIWRMVNSIPARIGGNGQVKRRLDRIVKDPV